MIRCSFQTATLLTVLSLAGGFPGVSFGATPVAAQSAAHASSRTVAARDQAKTAWRTYRNKAAGYRVSYPRSWKVSRSAAANGSLTTLMPRRGGTGITITVGPADANNPITSDIPNGHCQVIQQGGLTGARCFNTFSFTTYTVFFGANVTYTISAAKGANLTVYNRVVKSFRLISG